MISVEEMPENHAQALISRLEKLIHDLGQPLLVIRFANELLASKSEMLSKEDLAAKIALISQAIDESSAIANALNEDLQKLKKFIE
jgi:hypothetical protein